MHPVLSVAQLYASHRRLATSTVGRLAGGKGTFLYLVTEGRSLMSEFTLLFMASVTMICAVLFMVQPLLNRWLIMRLLARRQDREQTSTQRPRKPLSRNRKWRGAQ